MSATIAYVRVSTEDQSTNTQRATIEERHKVDHWFVDEATSGAIKAKDRKGLGGLLNFVRDGDTVIVYAIDRLGRNTVDVLETVETLNAKGVAVVSLREGFDMSTPMGKAMLTMLSAMAELERSNIKERQLAGINRAKAEGKALGREKIINDEDVAHWRQENSASIKATAEQFDISTASVKRACRTHKGNTKIL
ncbi:recombinase family protein [Vreelandella subglaciescola]|jgi:DNA invertase Pin-like site-specific DNA recombinase|uniref:Site-specific DNA recombinase n=1 Tax=Vreelandella subglaciescola TaxID=29571 RepID=A0A1M7EQY2_9GAMM|nr:recombinase family protein [Halomonas subglaciescola]SHL94090.1 Site-specific DNA recombinase [Halomonas subglaciescola]